MAEKSYFFAESHTLSPSVVALVQVSSYSSKLWKLERILILFFQIFNRMKSWYESWKICLWMKHFECNTLYSALKLFFLRLTWVVRVKNAFLSKKILLNLLINSLKGKYWHVSSEAIHPKRVSLKDNILCSSYQSTRASPKSEPTGCCQSCQKHQY